MKKDKLINKLEDRKFLSQIVEASKILAEFYNEEDKARCNLYSELCDVAGTLSIVISSDESNLMSQDDVNEESIIEYLKRHGIIS